MKRSLLLLVVLAVIAIPAALYFWVALSWSFSSGERAGWVQKLSKKGWVCKTWEGELAMVSMPGAMPEKFLFTIHDDDVAAQVTKVMGKRASLHYEEKVGLPSSCFGETRYFVKKVTLADEVSLSPGVVVPVPPSVPVPIPAPTPAVRPDMSPLPGASPPGLAASAPK